MGLPKFLSTSLSACHGLKIPADLHILAITDVLVLPSVNLKPLGIRLLGHLEAVPALKGTQLPLYRILCLRFAHFLFALTCSAMDTRLDTGGLLTFARLGLSPCKICQASLGAIRCDPNASIKGKTSI